MKKPMRNVRIVVLSAAIVLLASLANAQSVGAYRGAVGGREAALAGADNVLGTLPEEAFAALPITLTDGTNAVINSRVGSPRIDETVPLEWRNQVVRRAGVEYEWRPAFTVRGGYGYAPSSVPTTTLTPMTAAILEHTFGDHWNPTSTRVLPCVTPNPNRGTPILR